MLKHILFTHDDLDGAGCRVIFELFMGSLEKGKEFDVINCGNLSINTDVQNALDREDYIGEDTVIYFADICPSIEVATMLLNRFKRIVICDHHRTNFPITNVISDAIIMPEDSFGRLESGTSILYRYFCELMMRSNNEEEFKYLRSFYTGRSGAILSFFVDTVRSYDTYEWKTTNNILAKKLQLLFFLLGMDRFCKKYVDRIRQDTIPSEELIIPGDMEFIDAKLEFEQKIIDNITIGDVYDVEVMGLKTAFMITPIAANISEVAFQFLNKYPQFDLFASMTLARGGEFSFRTIRDDLDVGEFIAKPIGGGGHPKASGAPLPDYIKELLMEALLCHTNRKVFRVESWWEEDDFFFNNITEENNK